MQNKYAGNKWGASVTKLFHFTNTKCLFDLCSDVRDYVLNLEFVKKVCTVVFGFHVEYFFVIGVFFLFLFEKESFQARLKQR